MNKKLFGLVIVSFVLLLASAGLASAQYYYGGYYGGYGGNNYNSYSYNSVRNTNGFVRTTNYDRVNDRYWNGRSWVTTTSYVRTSTETPRYGYSPRYYGGYYRPWYQNYWNQPVNYYPRYNYGYGYY